MVAPSPTLFPPPELARQTPGGVDCHVVEVEARSRGYYVAGFRNFYVNTTGAVFLIRAPGERGTLQRVDDLPEGAEVDPHAPTDDILWHLASAAELVTT